MRNAQLKEELSKLSKRLDKLECPHNETKFERMDYISGYCEVCTSCGTIITTYLSHKEKIEAELVKLTAELIELKEQFKTKKADLESLNKMEKEE